MQSHLLPLLMFLSFVSALQAGEPSTKVGMRPWTLLMYGAVDNSADDPFVNFTNQVRRAIDGDPGIELLVFIDRSDKHAKRATFLGDDFTGTRLYRICKDKVERLAGGKHFPEITLDREAKLNSADAANLGKFIAWGKEQSPSERYGLLIYSHANGATMCPVERTKAEMHIPELTDKIAKTERVDFLALELCNMGGIEISYQWRPGNGRFEADVLLAIPNAGPPLDWHRAFARIRTPGHDAQGKNTLDPAQMTAKDFGKLVIEEGYLGREAEEKRRKRPSPESAGCYDLHQAATVKKAVDALAVELAQSNARDVVVALRSNSDKTEINYTSEGSYIDLYDLARRLADCERLGKPARIAAKEVMASLEKFIVASFGMQAYKNFQPNKNGVFIVMPNGKPDCWKRFRWYTPLAGDSKIYGNWAFLKDGATADNEKIENWFELLDSWFDTNDKEGGLNKYRP